MLGRVTSRARTVIILVAVLTAAGCGGGGGQGTPEGTLKALAAATSDSDDKAIAELICPEARDYADTIAQARAKAKEADPALADFGYDLTAGDVTDKTDTTAVGTLKIKVKGVPGNLSQQGRQFLDSAGAPLPIGLQHEGGRINLVKRDGVWLACK